MYANNITHMCSSAVSFYQGPLAHRYMYMTSGRSCGFKVQVISYPSNIAPKHQSKSECNLQYRKGDRLEE